MTSAPLTAAGLAQALSLPTGQVLALRDADVSPSLLDFVGLVREKRAPTAVVMHDGQPFVYVIEGVQAASKSAVAELREVLRLLALRDDAPYAAVVRPGTVEVFSLSAVRSEQAPVLTTPKLDAGLLARLVAGDLPDPTRAGGIGAHELMLELLNATTDHLITLRQRSPEEALALVGRALFMRFLGDRGILAADQPIPGVVTLSDCFATPAAAHATSLWLDQTFNGDLLGLPDKGSLAYFSSLVGVEDNTALSDLTAIVRGDRPVGDGAYQGRFRWSDLHFSYVPVGLLSQVYEQFAHRFETRSAKDKSVYYTPRHIAEYLVDRALRELGPKAHTARVLDPASGGGVFLLCMLRRLVRTRWEATGVRPRTNEIRSILNSQLVGFDINPAARQLTALALYLTALELDPDACTLSNLTFAPLQGSVLMAAEEWTSDDDNVELGSLSPEATARFVDQFDCCIGNPPWTAWKHKQSVKRLTEVTASRMQARGITPLRNPDGVPDLPFVWAATQWVKPDGVLAFALHGRLLNKLSPAGHEARTALFRGVDVSFVLNGLELRNTHVWPKMQHAFCLLVAHNRPATDNSAFHAITPVEDTQLNREGRIRIDSKDAWLSDVSMVASTPYLFKTLAKGNTLDVELLERVLSRGFPRLSDLIASGEVAAGDGYQGQQGLALGMPAEFLRRMPVMPVAAEACWVEVPVNSLPRFEATRVHRRRERMIYRAPLALLRESPNTRDECPLGLIARKDVAYSESFIGFSCHTAREPRELAVLLTCVFNSALFLYFNLMTSSKLGCERPSLLKNEVETFPVPSLEALTAQQRSELLKIERLWTKNQIAREEIDAWVRDVYRLRPADEILIADRLASGMPHRRKHSMQSPTELEAEAFGRVLAETLLPFQVGPRSLQATVFSQDASSPWRFLHLGEAGISPAFDARVLINSLAIGDMLDASLVEIPQQDGLTVGILNQRRYWSATAARTLALDLIRRPHSILTRDAG